jgi:hypothetical protein
MEGGGGVRTGTTSGTVTLINNTIRDNYTHGFGGGVEVNSASGTIILTNNTITNNSTFSGYGGGIHFDIFYGTVTLTNNIISYNSTKSSAGGILLSSLHGTFTMTNNTISYNSAQGGAGGAPEGFGGGVWLRHSFDDAISNIYNNIIWNNSAVNEGWDLYIENDGDPSPASVVNLFNNDFDQSSDGTYIKNPSTVNLADNINLPPQFDIDGYHLTASSPCIDAGLDAEVYGVYDDIDGDSRPQGDDYDIGADEFVPPMLDLDITHFTATKRVNLGSNKTVKISLAVKNMGALDGPCPATVVGVQGGEDVYTATELVSDAIGKGSTTIDFPSYKPTTAGDIDWTVTVDDGDTDVDVATAETIVN